MVMKSRERVKRAIHFEKPDRVPRLWVSLKTDFFPFFTFEPRSWQPKNYPPHLFGGTRTYKNRIYRDLVYRWKRKNRKALGLPRKWWNVEKEKQLSTIDEWGVIWKSGAANRDNTMGHPEKGPLQDSWDQLEEYQPFDPIAKSRYRMWNGIIKTLGKNRYIFGSPSTLCLHNQSSFIRGFSNIMIDFVKNPKKVDKLIAIVADIFYQQIETLKEKCPKLDAIFALDDLGTQKSPVISPKLFKRFFFKPYKRLIDLTHDLGMDFILHSCGQIAQLLPVFIDLGIDMMEFDSPNMTGVENYKKYAEEQKMAFWLSSNIQTTYSQGTPKEVEEEIKYYVKEIGNNQGGLAFYKYVDDKVLQTPKKNKGAFKHAMQKWGNYNKQGIIDWLV